MKDVLSGNLDENKERRGWFIGHFIDNPAFTSKDFEVRWGVHPKGEKKARVAANKTAKTMSILIKGKFTLKFPKDDKEIVMAKTGDFVFWDAKVYHSSEALEDSTVLTIRWPSVDNDQIPLSD
jgi:hypothetical protein